MSRPDRVCGRCSMPLIATGTNARSGPRICDACKLAARRERLGVEKVYRYQCASCGVTCERPPTRGQRPKWCDTCRHHDRSTRRCLACGTRTVGKQHNYCSRDCGRWERAWGATSAVPDTHPIRSSAVPLDHGSRQCVCPGCDVSFTRLRKDQVRCTPKCGKRSVWISPARRRYVYDRDQWRCQLCKLKINPRLRSPHPKSATIDHITPRARGGNNELDNLQAAHMICNALKSDQLAGDQLALIG